MKYRVFTVFDSKVEAYMNPFLMQTKNQAIRSFSDEVNNEQSMFNKHPEDYTLFEIGEYDDAQGVYTMHEAKQSLGLALEYKKQMALPMGGQQVSIPQVVK